MRDLRSLSVLLVVLVGGFLIFLSVLVSQVGGTQIRSAGQTELLGTLVSAQDTLSPGAPTVFQVRLSSPPVRAQTVLRLPNAVVTLGTVPAAAFAGGELVVSVPCGGTFWETLEGSLRGRVGLIAEQTGAVLAQSGEVTVLPAGPDCFFTKEFVVSSL
jgi:hypothetical protein